MLVYYAIELYILLIFVWVLGSWFPQWRQQAWFKFVQDIVEPYMRLFQGLNLRVGMFDLRPMVAIFVLWIFQILVRSVMFGGGRVL